MNFVVVGTSHKQAPIEVRERLAFTKKKAREALPVLAQVPGVKACVILSTCNRSEIYALCDGFLGSAEQIRDFFISFHGFSPESIGPFLYRREGKGAFHHLVRVSCGLDSQTFGEPQVLGQVKRALADAEERGCLNGAMKKVFSEAILGAERVRRQDGLIRPAPSIAERALQVVRDRSGGISGKLFLMIGTGKIMELWVPLLAAERARSFFIANRNHAKAEAWARTLGGGSGPLERIKELIPQADVIVSATSCSHIMIREKDLAMRKNGLVILDLAVPRDVDPSVKDLSGVMLFDLDDLGFVPGRDHDAMIQKAERAAREETEILWSAWSGSEREKVLSH